MEGLFISQEKMKELDAFIQEMPVKFGIPLINFFNELAKEGKNDEIVE